MQLVGWLGITYNCKASILQAEKKSLLGKEKKKDKSWMTKKIFDLMDARRESNNYAKERKKTDLTMCVSTMSNLRQITKLGKCAKVLRSL